MLILNIKNKNLEKSFFLRMVSVRILREIVRALNFLLEIIIKLSATTKL